MTTRARNIVPYGANGIGKPSGYSHYANPFRRPLGSGVGVGARAPAGNPAKFKIKVLSATIADFDGKAIIVPLVQATSESFDSRTFTFDDDAPPPSTATAINLQGLTTVAEIAAEISAAFTLAGFVVRPGFELDELWIFQPIGGDHGNQEITFTGDLTGEVSINDVTDLVGFEVFMYGGNTIEVPLLWGPRRGLGPTTPNNLQSELAPA